MKIFGHTFRGVSGPPFPEVPSYRHGTRNKEGQGGNEFGNGYELSGCFSRSIPSNTRNQFRNEVEIAF
jgi:hypothetical protein